METRTAGTRRWLAPILRLGILVPAGLLVFYHSTMVADILGGHGLSADTGYNAIQLALRLSIMASLIGVVLGRQVAIWAMWASIAGLIATQYAAHFGWVRADFTDGRHALSYLKGFIFPSIITLAAHARARMAP